MQKKWKKTGGESLPIPHNGDILSMGIGFATFYDVVKNHGLWDFKWGINEIVGRSIQLSQDWYRSDVPGNIHFGYIGLAVGLDERTLHCGADFATNGHWCSGSDPVEDYEAIEAGFELFRNSGGGVDEFTLEVVLRRHPNLAKKKPQLPHLKYL